MQDYQLLRALVLVAREGSISRAAEQLFLTQPAVSLKLKQLQERLNLTLFTRHPHGLTLTPDGQAILPAAEKALAAMAAFEQSALALHSTLRGRLRIGTIIDPEFIRLGDFLRRLVERAPQLETELHHGMSGEVENKVNRGELDIGFFLAPPGAGPGSTDNVLEYQELAHFNYHVVAPAGWGPYLQPADWPTLVALPWIITPPESVHYRLLHAVLEPQGLTQKGVARVDQEVCMLDLVRAGVGLCLARDALAIAERQKRGLVMVENLRIPCALSVIWPRDRGDEGPIAAAREVFAQVWPRSDWP